MFHNPKNKILLTLAKEIIAESKLNLVVLCLTVITSSFLQVLPAMILRNIINNHFSVNVFEGVWRLAILYLLVSGLNSATDFVKVISTSFIGRRTIMKLRNAMSIHISKLPISYFNKTPVGDVMSRLVSDVETINVLFTSGLVGMVTDMFKVVVLLISLFILSPMVCMVVVIFIPIVFLVSNFFRKKIYGKELLIRKWTGEMYIFIQEWLFGIRTIKAYGLEEHGKEKFQIPLSQHLKATNGSSFFDSWFPCVLQTLRATVISITLWVGSKNGTFLALALPIGDLVAIMDLVGKLFSPVESLATEFQTIQQAVSGLKRIRDFFHEPTEDRGSLENSDISIKPFMPVVIENVHFGYTEDKLILKNITLTLNPGEKVALVGRTGAGKTTLMQLVSGLFAPLSGSVKIGGYEPYYLPPDMRRKILGIVPQNVHLFEGTVRENITLHDETISHDDVVKATKIVGLHDTIQKLSNGYDTILGEGEQKLSHGESQLMSIARAVVTNPPILLLDEPTSGLDAKTEELIFEAIKKVSDGRSILTISHRLSGIIDADRVDILEYGKVAQSGTPDELSKKDGWYKVFKSLEDLGWQSE